MKIYEVYAHKSYEVDLNDIDFERTKSEGRGFRNGSFMKTSSGGKWYGNEIFFKRETLHKYSVPFFISKRNWEKIVALENAEINI